MARITLKPVYKAWNYYMYQLDYSFKVDILSRMLCSILPSTMALISSGWNNN